MGSSESPIKSNSDIADHHTSNQTSRITKNTSQSESYGNVYDERTEHAMKQYSFDPKTGRKETVFDFNCIKTIDPGSDFSSLSLQSEKISVKKPLAKSSTSQSALPSSFNPSATTTNFTTTESLTSSHPHPSARKNLSPLFEKDTFITSVPTGVHSTCSSLEVISELPSGRDKSFLIKEKLSLIEEIEMVSIDLEGSVLYESENETVTRNSYQYAGLITPVFQAMVFILSMVILARMGNSDTILELKSVAASIVFTFIFIEIHDWLHKKIFVHHFCKIKNCSALKFVKNI